MNMGFHSETCNFSLRLIFHNQDCDSENKQLEGDFGN